jgi:hypothetical protein
MYVVRCDFSLNSVCPDRLVDVLRRLPVARCITRQLQAAAQPSALQIPRPPPTTRSGSRRRYRLHHSTNLIRTREQNW